MLPVHLHPLIMWWPQSFMPSCLTSTMDILILIQQPNQLTSTNYPQPVTRTTNSQTIIFKQIKQTSVKLNQISPNRNERLTALLKSLLFIKFLLRQTAWSCLEQQSGVVICVVIDDPGVAVVVFLKCQPRCVSDPSLSVCCALNQFHPPSSPASLPGCRRLTVGARWKDGHS